MQALKLPASHGWRWIVEGFRLFRRNHLMLTFLVISYWLLMGILNTIPILGTMVSTLCIPAFSVSLMNACSSIESSRPLTPKILFSGFQRHLRPLLQLGAIYLAAMVVILGISSPVDDGSLFRLLLLGNTPDAEVITNGNLLFAAQISLALFCPLVMAYWYAPVLAGWHGFSAGKSLFFSFVACARNWRAFLVYSSGLLAITFLLLFVVQILTLVLPTAGAGLVTSLAMILAILILAPTMFASFYVSYRDVFIAGSADP